MIYRDIETVHVPSVYLTAFTNTISVLINPVSCNHIQKSN